MLRPLDRLEVDAFLDHLPEWAHFAQFLDLLDALARRVDHFFLGREAAQAEAYRRVRQVLVSSDGS